MEADRWKSQCQLYHQWKLGRRTWLSCANKQAEWHASELKLPSLQRQALPAQGTMECFIFVPKKGKKRPGSAKSSGQWMRGQRDGSAGLGKLSESKRKGRETATRPAGPGAGLALSPGFDFSIICKSEAPSSRRRPRLQSQTWSHWVPLFYSRWVAWILPPKLLKSPKQ